MIALQAIYKSHRSTADGGFSLTLELADNMADNINEVFRLRDESLYVVVMTEAEYLTHNAKPDSRSTADG